MKRQEYFKLLLELVVIFLSVILAFLFDDFRESRNEKSHYKTDLLTLRNDLVGEINNVTAKIDTFQIKEDVPYRGRKLKQLIHLLWFDSLVNIKKASMMDFRFLIENFLVPDLGDYDKNPLANEILLKYSEQIIDKNSLDVLKIYIQEMNRLSLINNETNEAYKELEQFIRKMDPFMNFDKQDSGLLYSKEFIWAYKHYVGNHKDDFAYTRWLVQKRLIKVINGLNSELDNLGHKIKDDSNCYSPSFNKRFECENERKIENSDSLSRVDIKTIKYRTKYLQTMRQKKKL